MRYEIRGRVVDQFTVPNDPLSRRAAGFGLVNVSHLKPRQWRSGNLAVLAGAISANVSLQSGVGDKHSCLSSQHRRERRSPP